MYQTKKTTNEEKLAYLLQVFKEQKQRQDKVFKTYFSVFIVRFGQKMEVVHRAPVSEEIIEHIDHFSSRDMFKPDYIIVDLYSGRSHNVRKPIATFKFNYSFNRT